MIGNPKPRRRPGSRYSLPPFSFGARTDAQWAVAEGRTGAIERV